MKSVKLIELYGRRFTSSAKLLGFIAILIYGVSLAFNGERHDHANDSNTNVELLIEDEISIN